MTLPYIEHRCVSLASTGFSFKVSSEILSQADALPSTYFRSVPPDARSVRFEWRFRSFESRLQLHLDGGDVSSQNTDKPIERTKVITNRLANGSLSLAITLLPSGILREHAGEYRLIRCASESADDNAEQLIAMLSLYVTNTIDTIVLPPNTPSVLVTAPPESPYSGIDGSFTNWIVVALDKRVQHMRRPALRALNADLHDVYALLRAAMTHRDNFVWHMVDDTPAVDALSLQSYAQYADDDAPLWTTHPGLHDVLIHLLSSRDLAATNEVAVSCAWPVPHAVTFRWTGAIDEWIQQNNDFYNTWTQIVERIETDDGAISRSSETKTLKFCELLVNYTSRTYESTEPLYGVPECAEFEYITAAANELAFKHQLYLEFPTGADRVFEEYDLAQRRVGAPINWLCIAVRTSSKSSPALNAYNFAFANAAVVAITNVHVLPDCVIDDIRSPRLLSDGILPASDTNRSALEAIAQKDPRFYQLDNIAVRPYWYAVRMRNGPSASPQALLTSLARFLSAPPSYTTFIEARAFGDQPPIVSALDDDTKLTTLFVCVEELCDRLVAAESLFAPRAFNNANPLELNGTRTYVTENAVIDHKNAAVDSLNADASFIITLNELKFAPRRIRQVIRYMPAAVIAAIEREPTIEFVPPPVVQLRNALINTNASWDTDSALMLLRTHIKNALNTLPVNHDTIRCEPSAPINDVQSIGALVDLPRKQIDKQLTYLHYTGSATLPLRKINIATFLESLPDAIDASVLGEYERVDDVPICTLYKRYMQRRARNGLAPLQEMLATACINELNMRLNVLWTLVKRLNADVMLSYAARIEDVRLSDVDTRLLLATYGKSMSEQEREFVKHWHVPFLNAPLIDSLICIQPIVAAVIRHVFAARAAEEILGDLVNDDGYLRFGLPPLRLFEFPPDADGNQNIMKANVPHDDISGLLDLAALFGISGTNVNRSGVALWPSPLPGISQLPPPPPTPKLVTQTQQEITRELLEQALRSYSQRTWLSVAPPQLLHGINNTGLSSKQPGLDPEALLYLASVFGISSGMNRPSALTQPITQGTLTRAIQQSLLVAPPQLLGDIDIDKLPFTTATAAAVDPAALLQLASFFGISSGMNRPSALPQNTNGLIDKLITEAHTHHSLVAPRSLFQNLPLDSQLSGSLPLSVDALKLLELSALFGIQVSS